MQRIIPICSLLLLFAAGVPDTARAGLYFGPELTSSTVARGEGAFGEDFDDLAAGARFIVGHNANAWLDLEGSVGWLGEFRSPDLDVRYASAMAAARLRLALGSHARLYGRIGAGIMHINATHDQNDTKPAGLLGIGTELDISRQVAVRLGMDTHSFSTHISDDPDNASRTSQRLDTVYIGLTIRPRY